MFSFIIWWQVYDIVWVCSLGVGERGVWRQPYFLSMPNIVTCCCVCCVSVWRTITEEMVAARDGTSSHQTEALHRSEYSPLCGFRRNGKQPETQPPPIIQKRWLAQRSLASVQDARKVMHIVCEGLWRSGIPRERHRMSSNTTSSQLPLALQSRHASRKCPRGLRRPMPRPERLSEI